MQFNIDSIKHGNMTSRNEYNKNIILFKMISESDILYLFHFQAIVTPDLILYTYSDAVIDLFSKMFVYVLYLLTIGHP